MPTTTHKQTAPAHRLAAIMFTDIVGYTALMGSDEDKAFEILRMNRNIHISSIEKFNGSLIKEMGDGTLAQFNSAADAVRCAIEIQQEAGKELDARVRIGIHLGDITQENNDVLGDGVNIASRLQSIAEPGGIYISDSVHNSIRSKRDLESQYLGEVNLKNVSYPFKTYYLRGNGLSVPSKSRIEELTGVKRPASIVVLPFDNFTGSAEFDYFVSGMHASLIGAIGKVSGMRVISKTTANAFKNTGKSIPEIAAELEVNTVVEASVLNLSEKISLQVKLIHARPEEKQLWIQDYSEEKSQILNLYNRVTKEVSQALNVILKSSEKRFLEESKTVDREAYDAFLRSHQYWDDVSLESLNRARDYLNSAIEKDPNWAPLYAGLAKVWIGLNQMGFESPEKAVPVIYENINRALELDPEHADAHYLNALIAYLAEWDWKKGEKEFLKAIAINPNDAYSRIYYAHLLYILKRSDEAAVQAQLACELDPLNPIILITYSYALLCAQDFESAMIHAEKALEIDPESFIANNQVKEVAFRCENFEKAFKAEKLNLQVYSHAAGEFDEEDFREVEQTFEKQGFNAAYQELLLRYEALYEKGLINPGVMAIYYITGNQQEKAMECLEKGFELHDPQIPYIACGGYPFESLYENPRFTAILEKMNLPLP